MMTPMPIHFSLPTIIVARHDTVYVGMPNSYEIRKLDRRGVVVSILRKTFERVLTKRAHVDSAIGAWQRWMSRVNNRFVASQLAMLAGTPAAEMLPSFGPQAFRVTANGGLWVPRFAAAFDHLGMWDVFGPDGIFLGSMTLPERFRPIDVGVDYVIGLWTNADGVEYVRVYGLDRTESR